MKKIRSGVSVQQGISKGLSTGRSLVGTLTKSFSQANYSHMDEGLDDPLVRPHSNNSMGDISLASRSSRFFSDDEVPHRSNPVGCLASQLPEY